MIESKKDEKKKKLEILLKEYSKHSMLFAVSIGLGILFLAIVKGIAGAILLVLFLFLAIDQLNKGMKVKKKILELFEE